VLVKKGNVVYEIVLEKIVDEGDSWCLVYQIHKEELGKKSEMVTSGEADIDVERQVEVVKEQIKKMILEDSHY